MSLLSSLRARALSLVTRRKQRRSASSITVQWRLFGSGVQHVSRLADLSPGGAFVHAADPKPVGSPVVLELVSGPRHVNVHARIAWTAPSGMGLRFTRPVLLLGLV
jgi:hypothetical protein